MADLEAEVLAAAERAVKMSRDRGGTVLDYSEESIGVLEEIVSEAAEYAADMSEAALRRLAEDLGTHGCDCLTTQQAGQRHGKRRGTTYFCYGRFPHHSYLQHPRLCPATRPISGLRPFSRRHHRLSAAWRSAIRHPAHSHAPPV